MRLKAKNASLTSVSQNVLESAIECETESREKKTLARKAARELVFADMQTEDRKMFLARLEERDFEQERNIKSLIWYAKGITNDLDSFKGKVWSAEAVSNDLKATGK